MEYVRGVYLPVPQFEDAKFNLWYPITDGDHSSIEEIGEPVEFEKLISLLEEGDSLIADNPEIDEIEGMFPSLFVRYQAFWSGRSKLVYWPES